MECPRPLCEGLDPDCACALAGAASAPRAYPSSGWGWVRCAWYHYEAWEHEVDVLEEVRPPGKLTANDRVCMVCGVAR